MDAAANHVEPYTPAPSPPPPPLFTIGNQVWWDLNNNGTTVPMEATETGIDGVVLALRRCDGTGANCAAATFLDGTPVPNQVTAGGGRYQFADVPQYWTGQQGNTTYRVRVTVENFTGTTSPLATTLSTTGAATTWGTDQLDQGEGSSPDVTTGTGIESRPFNLEVDAGASPFLPVDFGFVKKSQTTVPDLVLTGSASPATASKGGTTTYVLQATNAAGSPNLTNSITLTDTLPTGFTAAQVTVGAVSAGNNWKCSTGTDAATGRAKVSCSFTASAAAPVVGGAQLGGLVSIKANVATSAASGSITNSPTLTRLSGESNVTNNTANIAVTVQ